MNRAYTQQVDTFEPGQNRHQILSGSQDEEYGALYVTVRDECDQAKRVASFAGDEADGFGLFELTAHLRGVNYIRRFHLTSGGLAIIPAKHLTNLSLTLLEWTGGKWRVEADLLPDESCSASPPPLYLHTEDAPGHHRVPHGADQLIPAVADPDFAWRTRGTASAKLPDVLTVPMTPGVPADVISGLYSTATTFRALWRIVP